MAYIVETGAGVEGANMYVSEEFLQEYCDERGIELVGDPKPAIVRGSFALDARYRARYPGTKKGGRTQLLEWPRVDAYDIHDQAISSSEVPIEMKWAACEAAVREHETRGFFQPDFDPTTRIKREKTGPLETEYFRSGSTAGSALVQVTVIDGILSSILLTSASAGVAGRTVRF